MEPTLPSTNLVDWLLSDETRRMLRNLVIELEIDWWFRYERRSSLSEWTDWVLGRIDEELRLRGTDDGVRHWVLGPIARAIIQRQLGPDPDPDDLYGLVQVATDVAAFGVRFQLPG